MPIKDNLSKLAKVVGENAVNAVKKSGDTIEITKLNIAVQSEEENLKSICSEIGMIIYRKFENGESIDEDLQPRCLKIREAEEKIKKHKDRILHIKKVKLCKSCNSEIERDLTFCPKCGTKQK